jgi:PAS domain-containing protein
MSTLAKRVAKHVADGIMLVQDHKLIFANDAFLFMFGYSSENHLIGKNVFDLISDEFKEYAFLNRGVDFGLKDIIHRLNGMASLQFCAQ